MSRCRTALIPHVWAFMRNVQTTQTQPYPPSRNPSEGGIDFCTLGVSLFSWEDVSSNWETIFSSWMVQVVQDSSVNRSNWVYSPRITLPCGIAVSRRRSAPFQQVNHRFAPVSFTRRWRRKCRVYSTLGTSSPTWINFADTSAPRLRYPPQTHFIGQSEHGIYGSFSPNVLATSWSYIVFYAVRLIWADCVVDQPRIVFEGILNISNCIDYQINFPYATSKNTPFFVGTLSTYQSHVRITSYLGQICELWVNTWSIIG